jgi:hypothetical protein
MDITELLAFSAKQGASDLHLSAGLPPMIRVDGDVRRINLPPMEHKDVHGMIYDIMNDSQRKAYEENLECDFSFEIPNLARFRVNAFNPGYTRHSMTPEGQAYLAEAEKHIAARTPLRRMAEMKEMVGPAVFLASDAASFVTGTILLADGGWCAQ